MELSYHWQLTPGTARANLSDAQGAEMAYERLDEALRQLKADRERAEAAEKPTKRGGGGSQNPVRAN